MTYKEKEQQLLETLAANNYQLFDGNKDEAFDMVEHSLLAFPNYVNSVATMEIEIPIWRARYDGQDFRDRLQEADTHRRIAHESAITNLSILNRVCKMSGLPPFADIDTNDRNAVAAFAGEYVSEIYKSATGGAVPEAKISSHMKELGRVLERMDRSDGPEKETPER